jgi:hypothetical protein
MTFFNKKEDVIKIELTPHGRRLLSKGLLKPEYYSFLDDDILYDSSNAGFTESNTESKTRILTETPYLRPQTSYKAVDENLQSMEDVDVQTKFLQETIGTNTSTDNNTAAWDITYLHGEISSSISYLSSPTAPLLQIPQIESTIEYTFTVDNIDNLSSDSAGLMDPIMEQQLTMPDGTFLRIDEEKMLLYIMEKNGFSHKDSYEIEVYLYEQDEKKLEKRLSFVHQDVQIENGMLKHEIDATEAEAHIDPEHVEYYLNIQTDADIPRESICSGLVKLQEKNIFLDIQEECPDRTDLEVDFYGSSVTPDDLEEC